jgi:hypothetical protein
MKPADGQDSSPTSSANRGMRQASKAAQPLDTLSLLLRRPTAPDWPTNRLSGLVEPVGECRLVGRSPQRAKRRRQAGCRSAKLGGSRGRGGMADALDLGSSEETRGGSSPPAHTQNSASPDNEETARTSAPNSIVKGSLVKTCRDLVGEWRSTQFAGFRSPQQRARPVSTARGKGPGQYQPGSVLSHS